MNALRVGLWLLLMGWGVRLVGGQAPVSGAVDGLSEARAAVAASGSADSLSKAEAQVRSYMAGHPGSADAHFLLGYILFREKHAKESLAEYTAGAAIRRPKADDLKVVASDYVLLADLEDADKWLSEVTAENPEDANAWYLLGRTKFNEGYYDKAVPCFERALTLHPKYVEAENNLGLAYRELNEMDKAKAAYQLAIDWQAETPKDAQPYLNMGALLVDQGEVEKSVPFLSKAVELSPNNPKTHEQLATAYQAEQKLDSAEAEMEKAVELSPETSALHFKLGAIYRKAGKRDLAQEQFKISERLNSTHSSKEIPNPFSPEPTAPR